MPTNQRASGQRGSHNVEIDALSYDLPSLWVDVLTHFLLAEEATQQTRHGETHFEPSCK